MANDSNQNQGDNKNEKQNYKIKLPEEIEEGKYANAVSVHFTGNECVLDLAYRINRGEETIIKVVSRVNMTHRTAESLLKVLSNALLDWKNKSSENNKTKKNNNSQE